MQLKPAVPTVVVETGTLLTLLLGGKRGWQGYAYAKLLADSAKKGLIKLVTTDIVLGEFMGSVAPLYAEDFTSKPPLFDISKIPKGFAHSKERIEFINDLLNNNALTVLKTPAADEYMDRIVEYKGPKSLYDDGKDKKKRNKGTAVDAGNNWPQTPDELRKILMQPKHRISKEIRKKESSLEIASGKRHRGEVSVADAIKELQKEDESVQIFALFEGNDDRGIIVQRLSNEKDSDDYNILDGKPLPEYNPNSSKFDKENAKSLGNVNLLSTKGFLAGFMYAARELSPENDGWYILEYGEGKNNYGKLTAKQRFQDAYEKILENVNDNGLNRNYKRYRDQHITQMMKEKEDEFSKINGKPQDAPWLNYIKQVVDYELGNSNDTKPKVLSCIVRDFVEYRRVQTLDALEKEVKTMSPLEQYAAIQQLEKLAALAEKSQKQ